MDNIEKIFEFTKISEELKNTKRWMHTVQMTKKETSADHSWHLALLVPIVAKELNLDVNLEKSILLALIHDLVEAIAGDTDYSSIANGINTIEDKNRKERQAIKEIEKSLPEKSGKMVKEIWEEYDKAETKEARFIKALDKIEAINHMLVVGMQCYDQPDLIAPYPIKAVINFPDLKPVLKELHKRLKPTFAKLNWEWKKEYDNY